MYILNKPSWNIKETHVTDERIVKSRRSFLGTIGAVSITGGFSADVLADTAWANQNYHNAPRNEKFNLADDITPEKLSSKYNNFFEFGSTKNIWKEAQNLNTQEWTVNISGLVEKPFKLDIDALTTKFYLEDYCFYTNY